MMASTPPSFILVISCLEQNKRVFLSEKPLRTSGKFCLNKLLIKIIRVRSIFFYLTPYHIDITEEIPHNVTRRQIQKQMRLKWRNNIKARAFF